MNGTIERTGDAKDDRGGRRIAFVTFGCRLNKAEALDLEAQYAAAGWQIVTLKTDVQPNALAPATHHPDQSPSPDEDTPDVIIVRGCSVTAKAQRDCEKAIAHLRTRFPTADLRITGCLPQATRPENFKPPTTNYQPPTTNYQLSTTNYQLPTTNYQLSRAYLKVQDGCSGKCAYCIVPQFRGSPVSVPFNDVLARARAFLAAGFREIVLTGCNLSLYRSGGHGLPDLAAALAALDSPGHRIRLGSIEPGLCDAPLLDALEAHPNICRFLHLSLQSGSNPVLARMRRPYTIEQMADFCTAAHRRLGPRLALGADLITGFPGETEDDHAATRAFLTRFPFIHLHVFPYSERPGTEAATLTPAVPVAVRRARAKELSQIGATQRARFAESLIGQEVTVCVERDGNGRTDEYLRCLLIAPSTLNNQLSTTNYQLPTPNSQLPTTNYQLPTNRRSLVRATVKKYFPKTGAVSATIRAVN